MTHLSRRTFLSWAAVMGSGLLPSLAYTQPKIDTLRVLVGFSPGGTADTVGRWLANQLSGGYADSAVVDNRTGAGGQIAIQAIKGLPNDGTNILVTPASMLAIYPFIYEKLAYDPLTDLTPLAMACSFEFGLAVGPVVPESVTSISEFLAWARENPALANFGSPAAGSTPHFVGELLSRAEKADMRHIAYRGSQPAVMDLMGGQIAAVSAPIGEFLQHLPTGKIRLLATSGMERSKFTPSVPTYREQGLEDLVFDEWFGVFGPPNLPADKVANLNSAIRGALTSPELIEGLATMGMDVSPTSADELNARLNADLKRWGGIVKEIGFQPL